MQGVTLHWTVSTGFSIAESVNAAFPVGQSPEATSYSLKAANAEFSSFMQECWQGVQVAASTGCEAAAEMEGMLRSKQTQVLDEAAEVLKACGLV